MTATKGARQIDIINNLTGEVEALKAEAQREREIANAISKKLDDALARIKELEAK